MIAAMLEILANWWGIIVTVIVILLGLLFYRKQTLEWIKGLRVLNPLSN